jgi:hypothetical protein
VNGILTFDEPTHTYRVGERVVPSVTQVLDRLHTFGMVSAEVLEAAKERGTNVHKLTQYHDEGDLDPATVGEYQGYYNGWLRFLADQQPKWVGIEERGYSSRFGFAGTWDRRGAIRIAPRAVIDVKTSLQAHRVWGMQTAAYRQIATELDPYWLTARRFTVQLRPDGTYRLIPWDDPDDWSAFLALIHLTNWSNKQ